MKDYGGDAVVGSAVTSILPTCSPWSFLHQYRNLCLMPRDSSPAPASLAPKRKPVHCVCCRLHGLGHHGSRHVNLARCPLHRYLRSLGASLARPPPGRSWCRPPHEAWPLARILSCCCRSWAVPGRWWSHAVGRRQASLGTPIPRTPTLLLHLDLFEI